MATDLFNAFCKHADVHISGKFHGPLVGLTFAAKDNFAVKGFKSCAGNPDWLRTHEAAKQTSSVIQTLINAGATLIGKNILDELALSLAGDNTHYGIPVNPYCPDRLPGGSSSGSAVAVASKEVDFALGTDTSGSMRVPASYCGLWGIRPTYGRISMENVVPLAPSFDTVGWFARSAELLARIGKILLNESVTNFKPKTIYIIEDAFALTDTNEKKILLSTAKEAFKNTKPIKLTHDHFETWRKTDVILKQYEIWQAHSEWYTKVKPNLAYAIEQRFINCSKITKKQYLAEKKQRAEIKKFLDDLLGKDNLLCLPTVPGFAPLISADAEEIENTHNKTFKLSCIANLAGLPQVNIPIFSDKNCPLGLSLIAPTNFDSQLLNFLAKKLIQNKIISI